MASKSVTPKLQLDYSPIRRARRLQEMTQDQLADRAGLHPFTVHRIETNRCDPLAIHLFAIARALGRPIHELVVVK